MSYSELTTDVILHLAREGDQALLSAMPGLVKMAEAEIDSDPLLTSVTYREKSSDIVFYPSGDSTGASLALFGQHGCPGWYVTDQDEVIVYDLNDCSTEVVFDADLDEFPDALEYSDSLPDDFLNVLHLHIEGTEEPIEYVTPHRFYKREFHGTYNGIDSFRNSTSRYREFQGNRENITVYTIMGRNIFVAPPPGLTRTGKLIYRATLNPLTNKTTDGVEPSNWLYDNYRNIYFYKLMEHSELFLHNYDRSNMWNIRYKSAARELQTTDNLARNGSSALRKRGR